MESENEIISCEFEFQCPLKWRDLHRDADENVRFCTKCEKDVHFARTQEDLNRLVKLNVCIAVLCGEKCVGCDADLGPKETYCRRCGRVQDPESFHKSQEDVLMGVVVDQSRDIQNRETRNTEISNQKEAVFDKNPTLEPPTESGWKAKFKKWLSKD